MNLDFKRFNVIVNDYNKLIEETKERNAEIKEYERLSKENLNKEYLKEDRFTFTFIVILLAIFSVAMLITCVLAPKENINNFDITKTEYNNVYELTDKSWFIIDRENNKYVFQPVELGDWDYEVNSETELKNIIATYLINKYNTNENEIINNIDKVFKTIE